MLIFLVRVVGLQRQAITKFITKFYPLIKKIKVYTIILKKGSQKNLLFKVLELGGDTIGRTKFSYKISHSLKLQSYSISFYQR